MNLPNKLTVFRMCLIPFFVVFALLSKDTAWTDWPRFAAILIFVTASLTDLFDGKIARKRNLVTDFGKFMDPLADKLLVCTALVCLVYIQRFNEACLFNAGAENLVFLIAVLCIIAREFIISGFRLIAVENGLVLAASKMGKLKTTIQMIMTISLLLHVNWPPFQILEWVLILAALVLTVLSLAEYLVKNRFVIKGKM